MLVLDEMVFCSSTEDFRELIERDLEPEGAGFSMSCLLCECTTPSSSSSSPVSLNRGSRSADCLGEDSGASAYAEALTIESMSQNWSTFITIGIAPMTLSCVQSESLKNAQTTHNMI